jgi:hypothetical protein
MKKYCENCSKEVDGEDIISTLPWEYRTVRITEALNNIIRNLGTIPIEELEKLGDTYGTR